jgi:hypothetical protein
MEIFIMKKQIIAAAVAATMTSVALADISITGTTKVNFKSVDYDDNDSTNTVSTEHDIKITGKNGDTTVVIGLEMDEGDEADTGVDTTDVYLATKIGDINVKAGEWDNGNNFLRGSSTTDNALQLDGKVGPIGIAYFSGHSTIDDKITVSADLAGVAVKYVKQNGADGSTVYSGDHEVMASTSFGGVGIAYHLDANDKANTDRSSLELTGKVADLDVAFVSIETDSGATADGDTWAGDFEDTTSGGYKKQAGADIQAFKVAGNLAGNKVQFIHTAVDKGNGSGRDADNNKFIVTRPLASGATFEAMYITSEVTGVAAESGDTLDLELSVKF